MKNIDKRIAVAVILGLLLCIGAVANYGSLHQYKNDRPEE
jgi:hypothetical protein